MIYVDNLVKNRQNEIFCFETKTSIRTRTKTSLLIDAVLGTSTVTFSIN